MCKVARSEKMLKFVRIRLTLKVYQHSRVMAANRLKRPTSIPLSKLFIQKRQAIQLRQTKLVNRFWLALLGPNPQIPKYTLHLLPSIYLFAFLSNSNFNIGAIYRFASYLIHHSAIDRSGFVLIAISYAKQENNKGKEKAARKYS